MVTNGEEISANPKLAALRVYTIKMARVKDRKAKRVKDGAPEFKSCLAEKNSTRRQGKVQSQVIRSTEQSCMPAYCCFLAVEVG